MTNLEKSNPSPAGSRQEIYLKPRRHQYSCTQLDYWATAESLATDNYIKPEVTALTAAEGCHLSIA